MNAKAAAVTINTLLTAAVVVLFSFFAFASNRWIVNREDNEKNFAAKLSGLEQRIQRLEDKR